MRVEVSGKATIVDRSFAYALRVIRLYRALERDNVGRIVGNQLLRSGTSIGANAHEAQGAQSRADFISKMSVAQKEAHESLYWLRLIQRSELLPSERLDELVDETQQLLRMLSAILVSAKRPRQAGK